MEPPEIPPTTPEPPAILPGTSDREEEAEGPVDESPNPFLISPSPAAEQPELVYPDGTPFGSHLGGGHLEGGYLDEACREGYNCVVCGGGSCAPPTFSLFQGVRVLTHNHARGSVLSFELLADFGVFVSRMTVRSLNFDVAAGYNVTAQRYLGRDSENRDQFFEFGYWGMNHWRSSHTVNGEQLTYNDTIPDPDNPDETIQVPTLIAGNLFAPFDTGIGGFNRALSHTATYESDINNFELNVRITPRGRKPRSAYRNGRWQYECQPGRYKSLLFGLRYLSLDEGFHFQSRGLAAPLDDQGEIITVAAVSGDYLILSHNDMVGFQVGMESIHRKCRWEWGFRAKAGPMINFSDQNTLIRNDVPEDTDPFHTTNVSLFHVVRAEEISLILEGGAVGAYKLRPNFTLRAAYDLMWVTGLSMAPEQIGFDLGRAAEVNTNGKLFSHGLTMGLEWTW